MEIWKNIEGYEGLYQVSNEGMIKSLGNNKTRKEKILKPVENKDGYLYVKLCKNCEYKNYFIHRLVADAFIPNQDNLPEVNHKDEDKTNNRVENLEWCNRKYNVNYGTRNLKSSISLGKKVLCIETGIIYNSIKEAERQTGISNSNIVKACKGKYKNAGSFHWKYV